MELTSTNPATGDRLATYRQHSDEEVIARIRQAATASRSWAEATFDDRAKVLRRVAASLLKHIDDHARLMAMEMGKPITQGRSEVEKCAAACEFFAAHAEKFLQLEEVPSEAQRSFVCFRPLGVVLAIMPWNFPFWQVIRCVAPALMAGNVVLLKHAANVTGCALAIEGAFQAAGAPPGVFSLLLLESGRLKGIISHESIAAVTLTGSVEAGRRVAGSAGEALKKTVLELGGSDAYVILPDADVSRAAQVCAQSRLINSGQSCIAAKRFIPVGEIQHEFEERLMAELRRARVGDPLDPETVVGPLARTDLREDLHDQVNRSIQAGARCVLGGKIPEGRGAFYPPTLLLDVTREMPAFREETFGPVAAVSGAKNVEQAVDFANATSFGLGAAVFTSSIARGTELASRHLAAGACFVNTHVRSDPRLPFGGIKDSGYGRELGLIGIREFVNVKTVWVA